MKYEQRLKRQLSIEHIYPIQHRTASWQDAGRRNFNILVAPKIGLEEAIILILICLSTSIGLTPGGKA